MSEHTFDAFTRRATVAVTRRGSLLALGGAALATGLGRSTKVAAKDNKDKKKAKKAKKKFQKRCNQQKAQCQATVLAQDAPEALVCCESCFSGDFLGCILALNAERR